MHYAKSIAQIEEEFHTQQAEGLSTKEVPKRRETYGLNSLPRDTNKAGKVKIFLDQWKSPLIIILVVAGTISGFLGERIDMTIIYITALLNALIGFFQEYKANSALARLQSLVSFSSIVLRDGKKMQLPSEEIVPGDIVCLEAGYSVPGDGRLVQVQQFAVNESVLTGESVPVKKSLRVVKGNVSLGERKNMVFKGTTVSEGTGIYIVTAIGAETELGTSCKEVLFAREEGVQFLFEHSPVECEGRQQVSAVRFDTPGGTVAIEAERVILALGQLPNPPEWLGHFGIRTDRHGRILVDEQGHTTHPQIWAGGDNTHGPALAVQAMAAGRTAAEGMANSLTLLQSVRR